MPYPTISPICCDGGSEWLKTLGGLVVLEELARVVGVREEVDRVLGGQSRGRGCRPGEFVLALVGMLCAEGRRLEDLRKFAGERRFCGIRLGAGARCRDSGEMASPTRAGGG
jgi:hypothetical protein